MSKKVIKQNHALFRVQESEAELNRARSLTVGTAFGGTVEIGMRANDGSNLWCIMQPVEAIELIHQLAAAVGCHIYLQPRKDFSSWRNWREPDEQKQPIFNGAPPFSNHPPFASAISNTSEIGRVLPSLEQEPKLKIERNNHEPVATKKTVNRRSTKRAAATA